MMVEQFIDPKEVSIGGRQFKVSRIPALKAHSLYAKIVRSVGDLGKLGMTMLPDDVARDILGYCAAKTVNGGWTVLDTEDVVNSYLPNLADLIALQFKMVELNFGFFLDGSLIELLGAQPE